MRIIQIAFVLVGVIVTLILGYWQWTRWHEVDGTFQNLGYAVQWPIFGGFLVFMYRKYLEYEKERALGNQEAAVRRPSPGEMTEIPQGFYQAEHPEPEALDDLLFQDTRRQDRKRRASASPPGPANPPGAAPGLASPGNSEQADPPGSSRSTETPPQQGTSPTTTPPTPRNEQQ